MSTVMQENVFGAGDGVDGWGWVGNRMRLTNQFSNPMLLFQSP